METGVRVEDTTGGGGGGRGIFLMWYWEVSNGIIGYGILLYKRMERITFSDYPFMYCAFDYEDA